MGNNESATIFEGYLWDLGCLVKELAIESQLVAREKNTDFSMGYMAGFHRIVSLMQQQAEAFGIPIDKIGLDGIDPNIHLV